MGADERVQRRADRRRRIALETIVDRSVSTCATCTWIAYILAGPSIMPGELLIIVAATLRLSTRWLRDETRTRSSRKEGRAERRESGP